MRASIRLPAFDCARQYSQACLVTANVPLRWTAITASQSASVHVARIESRTIPALFTTPVSVPNVSTAVLIMSATSSQHDTEPVCATAFPPAASISATTSAAGPAPSPAVPSRLTPGSLTTTEAPWADSARQWPRPMPRPPPVTRTTRPDSAPVMTAPLLEQCTDEAASLRPVRAAPIRVAGLGDDQVDVVGRGGRRAAQLVDQRRVPGDRRRDRDDRQPAAAHPGRCAVVGMPADAADHFLAAAFDVDLPERVDLDGGVDRDERLAARQPGDVVGVVDAPQYRLAVRPVVQLLGAEQVSSRRHIDQHSARVHVDYRVGRQAGVDVQRARRLP